MGKHIFTGKHMEKPYVDDNDYGFTGDNTYWEKPQIYHDLNGKTPFYQEKPQIYRDLNGKTHFYQGKNT